MTALLIAVGVLLALTALAFLGWYTALKHEHEEWDQ